MDVCAACIVPEIIKPFERKLIPTGLIFLIPEGFEIQLRARSGIAIEHGITLVNGIGTIDSDFRGELQIPVINLSTKTFTLSPGIRIAQIVLQRVERISFKFDDSHFLCEKSDRGESGFGSTGF